MLLNRIISKQIINDGVAGGIEWNGERKRDYYVSAKEKKNRWVYVFKKKFEK